MSVRKQLNIRWHFRKLCNHPNLDALLTALDVGERPIAVGWGYRPSGYSALKIAKGNDLKLLLLEDALIRSLKPGCGQIYGLVADSRGIYYDASGQSDLIEALNTGRPEGWMKTSVTSPERIQQIIGRFRNSGISKYNWYPGDYSGSDPQHEAGVMVVDQTRGDTAIAKGGVAPGAFDQMVKDALDEHPSKTIYLRAHPDHRYRGKHSCFSEWVYSEPRIEILPPDLSPAKCFKFCEEVYAATSLLGMEALIHGRKVKSYGWNFYTGWGLTEDRCPSARPTRKQNVSLERLFEAAYLQYSHFFDPDTEESCEMDRILDHFELQRKVARENAGTKISIGFDPWKRSISETFFRSPGSELIHAGSMDEALAKKGEIPDAKFLLWGAAAAPEPRENHIVRVEDGFLRSAGLGAAFHKPLSWVCDETGIYFNPAAPSKLEQLIESGDFSEKEIDDAKELSEFLKTNRLSKYNLTEPQITWSKEMALGKKVVLVPGQVELDASIKLGSPEIRTNGDLLKRVRNEEPDAYLIFKCHPDLVAGARHGQLLPDGAEEIADLVVTTGNVIAWLELCDEVHTMTSTVGFEAILRDIPVRTYGMPFYAGWGLSRDHLTCERRKRRATAIELVCATLICYPRYLNPMSGEFTTAIQIARLLARGEKVDSRAWYLRIISILKGLWVKINR